MANMEVKKWNAYSQGERENLLLHWFHYYGKGTYSWGELEKVRELIKKDPQQVLDVAIVDILTSGKGPSVLLAAIRCNQTEELFATLSDEETKQELSRHQDHVIRWLVQSYNQPQPSVSLSEDELLVELLSMFPELKESSPQIITVHFDETEKPKTKDFRTF